MIAEWFQLKVLALGVFFGFYFTRLFYRINAPKTYQIRSFLKKRK